MHFPRFENKNLISNLWCTSKSSSRERNQFGRWCCVKTTFSCFGSFLPPDIFQINKTPSQRICQNKSTGGSLRPIQVVKFSSLERTLFQMQLWKCDLMFLRFMPKLKCINLRSYPCRRLRTESRISHLSGPLCSTTIWCWLLRPNLDLPPSYVDIRIWKRQMARVINDIGTIIISGHFRYVCVGSPLW